MASDFEMFAGDTREIVFTVKDQDGIAVNLTSAVVLWKMAQSSWKIDLDAVVVVSKTSGAGQITLGNGTFTVHLMSPDTVDLEGSYYHEAQITLADGTIGTPVTGKIKVRPNLIEPR
jgi:hypothetical protein